MIWCEILNIVSGLLGPTYGGYPIKFILPEFVSYLGERGVCGKRFTCLYTSPYEHVQYNVSGPYVKYFCL